MTVTVCDQLDLFGGPPARVEFAVTHPTHRRTDPPTSRLAALDAIPGMSEARGIAFALLLHAGATGLNDFELAAATGGRYKQTSIGKRRHDLEVDGYVTGATYLDERDGDLVVLPLYRPSDTGSASRVYVVTDEGRAAAARFREVAR